MLAILWIVVGGRVGCKEIGRLFGPPPRSSPNNASIQDIQVKAKERDTYIHSLVVSLVCRHQEQRSGQKSGL